MIFKRKKKESRTRGQRIFIKPNEKRYLSDELESVLNGWRTGDTDIDSVINKYHSKLVGRSREQHRKNDYVRRYFQLLRTNVIGADGVVFHAVMQDEEGKRLVEHNTNLEKAWTRWQRKNTCDIAGKLDFIQMQQIILISVAQDGEALIRLIKDKNNPFGLSLQLIDIDKLDVNYNKKLSGNCFIRNSIEFNEYGKPLAYHLLEEDEQGILKRKKYKRIVADEIIHLFQTEFTGQKRGIPWVSTALFRLNMLNSYQNAAIVNANATAKKIAFFKKEYSDSSDVGNKPIFQDEHIGYSIIPSGYELIPFDSQYPNNEIEGFTKSILRGISSGLGVSYNSLASDLEGVNFSSLRHGAIDERDNYRTLQTWFVNAFLVPLYESWLKTALLSGAINGFTVNDFDACLAIRFQPRRWQWVDPAKEMAAFEKKLSIGVTTRADIIRETGSDPSHVFNQLKHENELLEDYNLNYLLHPQATSSPTQESPDDTEDSQTKRND